MKKEDGYENEKKDDHCIASGAYIFWVYCAGIYGAPKKLGRADLRIGGGKFDRGDRSSPPAHTEHDSSWTAITNEYLSEKTENFTLTLDMGKYYLAEDIEYSAYYNITFKEGSELCLNGHKLTFAASGYIFIVENSSSSSKPMVLSDCNGSQGEHSYYVNADDGRYVFYDEDGASSVPSDAETGTVIGGVVTHAKDKSGYAIYSYSASLTMTGGTIAGNTYGAGGGIYSNSTFTMTGGTISGNTASNGGGVSCMSPTMFGGTISGNTATNGGGLFGYTASFGDVLFDSNTAQNGSAAGFEKPANVVNGVQPSLDTYGGEYSGSGASLFYIQETGSIGLYGGSFTVESGTKLIDAQNSSLQIMGGLFDENFSASVYSAEISGGQYAAFPENYKQYIAQNFVLSENTETEGYPYAVVLSVGAGHVCEAGVFATALTAGGGDCTRAVHITFPKI